MFDYIKGEITEVTNKYIVIDINGVGYKTFCSTNSLRGVILGQQKKIFTYLHIKEDAHTLFGFTDQNERICFEIFIATNGIGPKLAIEILSTFNISQLKDCILTENVNMLTQVAGLGLKKSKKLIIESKDKMKLMMSETPSQHLDNDLIEALLSLGYTKKEIMNKIENYDNLEEGIKDMLKKLN
jgi:Holliday junction DNA helicase RuvA